ncbi:MAG: hypothetical protein R3B65_03055 [Candidatus Paceibacterota bacterium]
MEGVAHFDGTKKEEDLFDDRYEGEQAKFDQNELSEKSSRLMEKEIKKSSNWKELSTKVSNERTHPKLGDKNSGLGEENLVEDQKI